MTATISMRDAAKNVVERARLNDQNAIATIAWVRHMAERGDVGLRKGLDEIIRYARKNPPKELVPRTNPIGAVAANAINILRRPNLSSRDQAAALSILPMACQDGMLIGSVTLMQGPGLNDERIGWLADGYGDEGAKDLFLHGFVNGHRDPSIASAPPEMRGLLLAGKCAARGRALQVITIPSTLVTPYSPMVGWELGE